MKFEIWNFIKIVTINWQLDLIVFSNIKIPIFYLKQQRIYLEGTNDGEFIIIKQGPRLEVFQNKVGWGTWLIIIDFIFYDLSICELSRHSFINIFHRSERRLQRASSLHPSPFFSAHFPFPVLVFFKLFLLLHIIELICSSKSSRSTLIF